MLVLGITDGITCGAALVRDGCILAAVNEERLCRLKMAYGFPRQSIEAVLRLGGASPGDVDRIAAATNDNYFFDGVRPFDGWLEGDRGFLRNSIFTTAGQLSFLIDRVPGLERAYYAARRPIFAKRRQAIRRILREELGLKAPVEFVNHHLAHATSAYFTSGFRDATVVTMDGGGDGASSHIYDVRDGVFRRVGYTSAYHSLGNYYAYATHVCGFKAQKHEGKVTGLAAHGRTVHRDLLRRFIRLEDGEIRNVGGAVFSGAVRALRRRLPPSFRREDLAASIQAHAEDLATGYVAAHRRKDAPRDVALAGGLFANVRINQKVSEIPGVERVFVHPGMTDGGLAVGAALAPCIASRKQRRMQRCPEVIRDVYYGPAYSDREIERVLESHRLAYERPACIEAEVASRLAEGYVVARFDGRMEYGPRALGNRSILYQPGDPTVNDWLNEHLQRTEFMPFAPSTLAEHAPAYYRDLDRAFDAARFMTITSDCTDLTKKVCSGAVHVDGTARPQLVRREDNPGYHRVIDEFRKRTGIATLINTSFNMHEEPIVCSPEDAVRAFLCGHLDHLAIGPFLVRSPEPVRHPLHPVKADTGPHAAGRAPGQEISR